MIPAPGYHPETHPYLFLKDGRYISLVNTKDYRILPLIRSPNDIGYLGKYFLAVVPLSQDKPGPNNQDIVLLYSLDYSLIRNKH